MPVLLAGQVAELAIPETLVKFTVKRASFRKWWVISPRGQIVYTTTSEELAQMVADAATALQLED